jgi:hypothetical protein
MALIAKESGDGGSFTPVPEGTHLARCYRIIDMGTQKTEFEGKVKLLPKVMIQFEVHGEDMDGNSIVTGKGEPMSISKNYTLSLADKATLRKDLQTWRGKEFTQDELRGFELKNILGAWAMISVVRKAGNNGKEYTNIAGVMSVPSAIKKVGLPQHHNDLKLFSIDEPDMQLFETFGNSIRAKIEASPEWQARKGGASKPAGFKGSGFDDMEDDIPF